MPLLNPTNLSETGLEIVVLTRVEYDALNSPDDNTIYLIVEE